jgi:uncharacterized protein YhfF
MSKNTKHHINLSVIREKLPYGYMDKIRSKTDDSTLSDSLISQVINGKKRDHKGIIKAAIAIIKEYEEEQKQLTKEYDEITKS